MATRIMAVAKPLVFFCLALALASVPCRGGEVRMLDGNVFLVTLTDASGNPQEKFIPGDDMVFNVRFSLAMSEVTPYPVNVIIEIGEGPRKESIEAFSGRLDEGVWLLTESVRVTSGWGNEVPFKVVLKVRISNRKSGSTDSFYSYYVAEGTFRVGY